MVEALHHQIDPSLTETYRSYVEVKRNQLSLPQQVQGTQKLGKLRHYFRAVNALIKGGDESSRSLGIETETEKLLQNKVLPQQVVGISFEDGSVVTLPPTKDNSRIENPLVVSIGDLAAMRVVLADLVGAERDNYPEPPPISKKLSTELMWDLLYKMIGKEHNPQPPMRNVLSRRG